MMKLETYNYCQKTTNHAKWYLDRTMWVVLANSQFATVRFLSVFYGLTGTYTGCTGGPTLTVYTSYDVFPRKNVPFWGSVDISPNLGVKFSKTQNF